MKSDHLLSHFEYRSTYPCSAEHLYNWHSMPGALERLLPPWENTSIVARTGRIEVGSTTTLRMHAGLFPFTFTAHHTKNIPGRMFQDIQEKGPFASWSHSHFFKEVDDGAMLEDRIAYSLPAHRFIPGCIKERVEKKLLRMFEHREQVLREDLHLHRQCSNKPLRILISGASGVLGRELVPLLTTGGHEVWTLVRRPPAPGSNEIFWNPAEGVLNADDLPQLDAVIHLAGEYIGLSRWSEEKKRRVMDSRIKGTDLLTRTLAALPQPPATFLSASAVGYYGNCGDKWTDENHPAGNDYISQVCHHWEQAANPARAAGIRTVYLRLGVGLTPRGGALQRILASSPLGFIRRFGDGQQYISWISSDDMIAAILHILNCQELHGPVNVVAPEPVTNGTFMRTLALVAGRPLLIPLPGRFLQILYGQMASEILLSGCRAQSTQLQQSGFRFRHPTLEKALKSLLGK